MNKIKASALPYNIHSFSLIMKLSMLARLIGISPRLLNGAGGIELDALAGVILYRHLSRMQRIEVLKRVRDLKNPILADRLRGKVAMVLVQPQWGIWSLSNNELLEDQRLHAMIDEYASILGVSVSVFGARTLFSDVWKHQKIKKGGLATLVIWGAIYFNKTELNKANREISRRSKLNTSPHY